MPYAVDNAWFARKAAESAPHQPALRASLQLEPNRPVILFASKLQERKHAIHLVEAYAELLKSNPTPYLVVVGDGEERAHLEAFVRDHNLTGVRLAGFQNQSALPAFFQLADVFVLPSRHEPWGLIINEAMAVGTAVIASDDVGSHTDLITNNVEGFVYPTGNIPALTAALETVLVEPRTMGQNAAHRMQTWSFEQDITGLRAALANATGRLRS